MKFSRWLCVLSLLCGASGWAWAAPGKPIPGRLFYTPAERAMLINARTHKITEVRKSTTPPESPPVRFDGVITRSDGATTHWINGRPHSGQPRLPHLKPGQTRAQKQVFEPYQLQGPSESLPRPQTAPPTEREPNP